MSAKEMNLKIEEITNDYLFLLSRAKNFEEKKKLFEIYYKTLIAFQNIKIKEVKKILD